MPVLCLRSDHKVWCNYINASEEDLKVMLEVAEAKAAKPVRRKRAAPETWSTSKSDGIKLKIKKNK